MKVWFMFDNHAFSLVGNSFTPRKEMQEKAADLFQQDGCGHIFARDTKDGEICKGLTGSRRSTGQWGVDVSDLDKFFDAVDEYVNWEAR